MSITGPGCGSVPKCIPGMYEIQVLSPAPTNIKYTQDIVLFKKKNFRKGVFEKNLEKKYQYQKIRMLKYCSKKLAGTTL